MMTLPYGTIPLGPRPVTTNVVGRQRWLSTLAASVEAAPDALTRLVATSALARMLACVERANVADARSGGASWTVIGEQLGVSKQAAVKRFGPPKATPVKALPAVVAPRVEQGWDMTTPGGRTLLRFVKRPAA